MKARKMISMLLIILLIIVQQLFIPPLTNGTKAQTPEFTIITPYYGYKVIRSFFDHKYPTYNGYPNSEYDYSNYFVKYDGQQWVGNVSIGSCVSTINCYDGHNGYDFAMDEEPVLAVANGTVIKAGYQFSGCHNGDTCEYGMQIWIYHYVGGKTYRTRYGHLTSINVQEDEDVTVGEIIGTSGSTGSSTGAHLHFDVSICKNDVCTDESDFQPMDPFGWIPTPGAPVQTDPWGPYLTPYLPIYGCMWREGQFADTCNPIKPSAAISAPIHGNDIILIDDTILNDSGFIKGRGSHDLVGCPGISYDDTCPKWWYEPYGFEGRHSFWTITDGLEGNINTEDNYAMWKPPDLQLGFYEIYVWVPNIFRPWDEFTWQAHFVVIHAYGSPSQVYVDQYVGQDQGGYDQRDKWLSIGIHFLDQDSYIYFADNKEPTGHCPYGEPYNGQNWCRASVDAIKFVKVGSSIFLPGLIKTN